MLLSPRYDGPVILTIDGPIDDQLAPIVRQRRRMETMLAALDDEQWRAPSRCAGWSVQDVVAHLVGVNPFWELSLSAGLAGAPTRVLGGFDPAASPPAMVGAMQQLTSTEVLERFVATNDGFLRVISSLDDHGWSTLAESPPGHVPIRLVAQHALWDCWIHERDITVPLGIAGCAEPDEVRSCLRYAAAVSPALALGLGRTIVGTFAVAASDPEVRFVVEVDTTVAVREGDAVEGAPCLRGRSVELVEALSIRGPLPVSAPAQWREALGGLAVAFDAVDGTW
jgi:uncharacterized protein (TIGR03083 family)